MNDTTNHIRFLVEKDISSSPRSARIEPTKFDKYVASSGLQKAIRRGHLTIALRCAARLICDDPARFWRRLVTIAFEDIGIGNLEVVSKVVFSGDFSWRQKVGGEWVVAAHLVGALCVADKDRIADELIVLCQLQPALEDRRRHWPYALDQSLLGILAASTPLESAALAAWYLAGTKRYRSPYLVARSSALGAIWKAYRGLGFNERIVQVCERGSPKGGEILAVLLPLIANDFDRKNARVDEPTLRTTPMLGDLPSYVFDGFTRDGLQAITKFLDLSKPWRAFLARHVARPSWKSVTADVLFRAESGHTNRRVRWGTGDRIVDEAARLIPGLPSAAADEGIALLSDELCLMDMARYEVISRRTSNLG